MAQKIGVIGLGMLENEVYKWFKEKNFLVFKKVLKKLYKDWLQNKP